MGFVLLRGGDNEKFRGLTACGKVDKLAANELPVLREGSESSCCNL